MEEKKRDSPQANRDRVGELEFQVLSLQEQVNKLIEHQMVTESVLKDNPLFREHVAARAAAARPARARGVGQTIGEAGGTEGPGRG